MLVSEQRANGWFDRKHFIYRNFKFLYQNPLYNKKMPAGYSTCVYFWKAMFSLLFFKHVIYMLFALKVCLKFVYDHAISPFLSPVLNSKVMDKVKSIDGEQIAFGIITTAVAAIGLIIIGGLYYNWGPLLATFFLIGVPLSAFSFLYQHSYAKDAEMMCRKQTCHPIIYNFIYYPIALLTVYTFDKASWNLFIGFFPTCFNGMIDAIVWCAKGIADIFMYSGFLSINLPLGYIILTAIIFAVIAGHIIDSLTQKMTEIQDEKIRNMSHFDFWSEFIETVLHESIVNYVRNKRNYFSIHVPSHEREKLYSEFERHLLEDLKQLIAQYKSDIENNESRPSKSDYNGGDPHRLVWLAFAGTIQFHRILDEFPSYYKFCEAREDINEFYRKKVQKEQTQRHEKFDRLCVKFTSWFGKVKLESSTAYTNFKYMAKGIKEKQCKYFQFHGEEDKDS